MPVAHGQHHSTATRLRCNDSIAVSLRAWYVNVREHLPGRPQQGVFVVLAVDVVSPVSREVVVGEVERHRPEGRVVRRSVEDDCVLVVLAVGYHVEPPRNWGQHARVDVVGVGDDIFAELFKTLRCHGAFECDVPYIVEPVLLLFEVLEPLILVLLCRVPEAVLVEVVGHAQLQQVCKVDYALVHVAVVLRDGPGCEEEGREGDELVSDVGVVLEHRSSYRPVEHRRDVACRSECCTAHPFDPRPEPSEPQDEAVVRGVLSIVVSVGQERLPPVFRRLSPVRLRRSTTQSPQRPTNLHNGESPNKQRPVPELHLARHQCIRA
ncbi:DUF1543 domain-containing protein [Babesia caballi]|uniref:DUF1543 domain-containing protein n=1 Tax=Babesia caballi TaxID=5871 RepID=A0AAV4LQM1_BABCB|nr:DUF1543 domain-containing protein [Babesia caballi]